MAPEILRMSDRPVNGTQKGDVYSFAIILQEFHTREAPYSGSYLEPKGKILSVNNRIKFQRLVRIFSNYWMRLRRYDVKNYAGREECDLHNLQIKPKTNYLIVSLFIQNISNFQYAYRDDLCKLPSL